MMTLSGMSIRRLVPDHWCRWLEYCVLLMIFFCAGFRLPLSPLLCYMAVLWLFMFNYEVSLMRSRTIPRPNAYLVILSYIRIKYEICQVKRSTHAVVSGNYSQVFYLFQFCFLCMSVIATTSLYFCYFLFVIPSSSLSWKACTSLCWPSLGDFRAKKIIDYQSCHCDR